MKYSGGIPSDYLETILSLPGSVFNFYGLQQVTEEHFRTKFILSDRYSSTKDFTDLQKRFSEGKFEFFEAMQHLAMNLFLRVMANGGITRVVIVEDGGYLAPLVNRLALQRIPVNEVFKKYSFQPDNFSESLGNKEFGAWIASRYCGSVEQTRNGHDALLAVENDLSGLAFPACSLAISRFKVLDESVEVAYSCINAIENILAGQGFVLNNRNCLVLGSLGAIGMQTMNILSRRLSQLSGIDLKTDHLEYPWEQVTSYHLLKNDTRYSVDLIFGVVDFPVLDVSFFEDLILNSQCKAIFLASGSTKRFEFLNFLNWTEYLLGRKDP